MARIPFVLYHYVTYYTVDQLNQIDNNSGDVSVDIANKIEHLEDQFDRLRTQIKHELSVERVVTVKTIIDALTSLPLSLKREYESTIAKYVPDMRKEEQIEDLFFHLNPLIPFIDYGLIEHVIKSLAVTG